MAITLDDVVIEQMETNQTLGMIKEKTDITFSMQNEGIGTLINQMQEFLGILKRNERLAAENRREALPPAAGDPTVTPPPTPDPTPNRNESGAFGDVPILTLGTGLGAMGLGAAMGYLSQWSAMVRAGFRTFGVDIQKGIDTVTDIFGRARSFVTGAINGAGTIFRMFFGGIAEFFDDIRGRVGGITSQVSDLMKPITDFFSRLANNPIVKVLGNIGKLLGRVAAPLFLALDIIGGIKDQVSELEEGAGAFATMGAAFKGVMDGIINFVLFPIELLKDAVSWVAGKLGFDQFESILDSFDIVTVVQDFVGSIFDNTVGLLLQLLDDFTAPLQDAYSKLFSGDFEGAFKSMIGIVLPSPDFLKFELPEVDLGFTQFGGGTVNLNPIPDAVYEYVGLPTPTKPDEPSEGGVGGEVPSEGRYEGMNAYERQVARMDRNEERMKRGMEIPDGTVRSGDTIQRVTNENAVTNQIANQSVENTANSQSAPIVIQDNSVNSSQQSNVSNTTSAPTPMRSPTNNNRTRASAYAGG